MSISGRPSELTNWLVKYARCEDHATPDSDFSENRGLLEIFCIGLLPPAQFK
jgi:hypothetical protein